MTANSCFLSEGVGPSMDELYIYVPTYSVQTYSTVHTSISAPALSTDIPTWVLLTPNSPHAPANSTLCTLISILAKYGIQAPYRYVGSMYVGMHVSTICRVPLPLSCASFFCLSTPPPPPSKKSFETSEQTWHYYRLPSNHDLRLSTRLSNEMPWITTTIIMVSILRQSHAAIKSCFRQTVILISPSFLPI